MQYEPLVTIVIPVYNGEKYVSQAIESALSQSYKNIEVLVINDGTPDNSEEVILRYADKVRYIKKENGGVSSVLNCAIQNMDGVWLSWLSHDDLYLPDKISSQIEVLNQLIEKDSSIDIERYVLSCQDQRIDENCNILPRGGTHHPKYTDKYDLVGKEIYDYTIGGCTVLASKSAYESVGGFDENNRTISDADMWFKLMLNDFCFVFSDEVHVQSRYHKDMVSVKRSELVKIEKDAFYVKSIQSVVGNVGDDIMKRITIAMTRMSLKKAAQTAKQAYGGNKFMLGLNLLKARCSCMVKNVLRRIYRFIKWH